MDNLHFVQSSSWQVLVRSMTILLDMLLSSSNAKPSLKHGGLVRTRRALRSVRNMGSLKLLADIAHKVGWLQSTRSHKYSVGVDECQREPW